MQRDKICRIVIVEPSAVVRAGLEALLSARTDIKVAACFESIDGCAERIASLHPDVVLINPVLVCQRSGSAVRSLFPEMNGSAVVAFVYGLFSERVLGQYDGVVTIHDGAGSIASKIRGALESTAGRFPGESAELSEREREILISVAKGLANKEIAERHHISIYTVITHRKNITRKTGIKSVAGLTVYALLNNLIDYPEMQ